MIRGFRLYDGLNLAVQLKVPTKILPSVAQVIVGLFQTFRGDNCRTAEINPELRALDDWRFSKRMPSRAAAVRELLRRDLTAEGFALAPAGEKSVNFGVTARASNGAASKDEPGA